MSKFIHDMKVCYAGFAYFNIIKKKFIKKCTYLKEIVTKVHISICLKSTMVRIATFEYIFTIKF